MLYSESPRHETELVADMESVDNTGAVVVSVCLDEQLDEMKKKKKYCFLTTNCDTPWDGNKDCIIQTQPNIILGDKKGIEENQSV
uniref:Uncharacterized protein n=1 Tax=Oryza punctata TaxID=4537 RepID=A0A0E0LUC2_ORYPU